MHSFPVDVSVKQIDGIDPGLVMFFFFYPRRKIREMVSSKVDFYTLNPSGRSIK